MLAKTRLGRDVLVHTAQGAFGFFRYFAELDDHSGLLVVEVSGRHRVTFSTDYEQQILSTNKWGAVRICFSARRCAIELGSSSWENVLHGQRSNVLSGRSQLCSYCRESIACNMDELGTTN